MSKLKPVTAIAGTGLLATLLSACTMFGTSTAPAPTASANPQVFQNQTASQAEIAAGAPSNALPAIATACPPIKVRTGGEALFSYGRGQVGNPRDLNFQAVIDQQSRNCTVSNGLISVDMGISGRVLLGPAGTQTAVTLPIRFAVESNGVAVYSEKFNKSVSIAPSAQSAEFSQVLNDVAIPYVGGENITIWVGFDSQG